MKNNPFKEKRASLENYIKEQIIGPGAYHNKYFLTNNDSWEKSEFNNKNITDCKAIDNMSELIPEVPAYQYSSGILFPVVKQKPEESVSKSVNEGKEENENTPENNSVDDDNITEATEENVTLKQQNYPNSFGLTFVIDENSDTDKSLEISFKARYYKKLNVKNLISNEFGVFVSEYQSEISDAIKKYFSEYFEIKLVDDNYFLVAKKTINKGDGYIIDYNCFNEFVKANIIDKINTHKDFTIKSLKTSSDSKNEYFGIEVDGDYSYQFYFKSKSKHNHQNVFTVLDDSIHNYIVKKLKENNNNYIKYQELINKLEVYLQLKQLVLSLRSGVEEKKQPTPIWQSNLAETTIPLPKIDSSKKVQRFNIQKLDFINQDNSEVLKNINYTVQYILKANKVCVKLIVSNDNELKLTFSEAGRLNKKDAVNKISLFGVTILVEEKKNNTLINYNPPQMLQGDEEDNFNKLLYRNFKDLGEGYNTSVNWGTNKNGYSFIATDFLPSEETPTVDYTPSKIDYKTNKVVPLITKETLYMRHLSSLSDSSDKELIKTLEEFVEAYKGWIELKREELAFEKKNNIELNDAILSRELNACEKDYKRLKRNIGLLNNDADAMAAFRTMNTAMFMQLHHSIKTKEAKKTNTTFDPDENNENFYKNIDLGENEYGWRSFQLAFVLLNIDAFVKPTEDDNTVEDVFGTGWPERNEIADLVWFPTGGGKTEAYLGIIAFTIAYRRFTKGAQSGGTTVLMRYTLRMLTLQQFQRATLLILALETIRKQEFTLSTNGSLGDERISIGLFVGGDSSPNAWDTSQYSKGMRKTLDDISKAIQNNKRIETKIPFTQCPWCASDLFQTEELNNISPNHEVVRYKVEDQLNIACNNEDCSFHALGDCASKEESLPLRLFDYDIYKYPPTLLFGTVDKFAALANKVSNITGDRNQDSKRLLGKGYKLDNLPPELIIQDELHLLLGPLGSAVGLYEKGIDFLCTYENDNGNKIQPKIVTSTATTRNTDKQIFALFNRRTEIFPKQGILCDDSFFSFYKRVEGNIDKYDAQRRYIGVLPIGKTQTWMQLRIISICLAHRLKFFKDKYSVKELFINPNVLELEDLNKVFDYYHTVLSYYNSLKDVGKAQSQLDHYLPGDVDFVIKNTIPSSFFDKLIRTYNSIANSELTGRLSGEEVKTNLSDIEKQWNLFNKNNHLEEKKNFPPEFVISTNMISVGIDVSRFNTIVMNSMPRNIAEYIQASSRVARDKDGVVFTVHHPYRSRDISHYQKFKEFHEKFYSYVEPISVTPFASKALDRYLAMFLALVVRHKTELSNDNHAKDFNNEIAAKVKKIMKDEILKINDNAIKLENFLNNPGANNDHLVSSIDGIIGTEEIEDIDKKLDDLFQIWNDRKSGTDEATDLNYRKYGDDGVSLFKDLKSEKHWKVTQSLRDIGETSVIKTVQQ